MAPKWVMSSYLLLFLLLFIITTTTIEYTCSLERGDSFYLQKGLGGNETFGADVTGSLVGKFYSIPDPT